MAEPERKQQTQKALEELLKGEEGLDLDGLRRVADLLASEKLEAIARQRNPESVEELKRLCGAYHEPAADFKVGDIARWKPGLKNKLHPAYDVPVVVWEILDEPRISPADSSGSQYFHERLDMQIAYHYEDGDLVVYHVDKQRFELHPDFVAR